MPISKEVTVTLYQFDELSDAAKDKARDWFRGLLEVDDYAKSVIEDATTIAEALGIEFRRHSVPLVGGGTRQDVSIWWGGICTQGSGLAYDATYCYRKGWQKALADHLGTEDTAPDGNTPLWAIGHALADAQRKAFYRLTATCKAKRDVDLYVTVDYAGDFAAPAADVEGALKSFAAWIYDSLKAEYEYRTSDEAIDEDISANEYTFDVTGKRCSWAD